MLAQITEGVDNFFQASPFASQFLGVFGIVPDIRIFEFAGNFIQAFALGIKVKDTPSGLRHALAFP